MTQLASKHVTVGISGGISAYRTLELIRLLRKNGANVRVMPTQNALQFVTELSLETLSGNPCLTQARQVDEGKINHIEEAYRSDVMVIAPATCDLIAKMAHGFADEILLQTLLSFRGPVVIAPAMETNMWEHAATQTNIEILKQRGIQVIGPCSGDLASGHRGVGRMVTPEELFEVIVTQLSPKDFANVRALVTAGPTLESIDPVRFLSNHSSGKMGVALARALAYRGAEVHLVHGPMQATLPELPQIRTYPVQNAGTMLDRVLSLSQGVDLVISCAAVADYKPETFASEKIKKSHESHWHLSLVKNPDILATLGKQGPKPFLVGFAAETSNLEQNAQKKCIEKNCDLVCANLVNQSGIGFGADDNCVTLIDKNGVVKSLVRQHKNQLAHQILDVIRSRMF